jgi:hypothetical protein
MKKCYDDIVAYPDTYHYPGSGSVPQCSRIRIREPTDKENHAKMYKNR